MVSDSMNEKNCPIETTLGYIGKRWSLMIIRDLFFGGKRFKDFLKANPELSAKVLSGRLKELEKNEIIQKEIVNTTPLLIEYSLTVKGKNLNKVLYEIAMFGVNNLSHKLTAKICSKESINSLKKQLNI